MLKKLKRIPRGVSTDILICTLVSSLAIFAAIYWYPADLYLICVPFALGCGGFGVVFRLFAWTHGMVVSRKVICTKTYGSGNRILKGNRKFFLHCYDSVTKQNRVYAFTWSQMRKEQRFVTFPHFTKGDDIVLYFWKNDKNMKNPIAWRGIRKGSETYF